VRHGETVSNFEKRMLGGGGDSPLTNNGRNQAILLGKKCAYIDFDAVYSSPLKRAIDTIEVAFSGKFKPTVDVRLTEIQLGDMEGLTWDEAFLAFPQSGTFMSDPSSYTPPPRGEKLLDVIQRVSAFLDDISKKDYASILVVTHGYIMRVFHSCILDKSIISIGNAPVYLNCEIAHYILDREKNQFVIQ